MPIRFRCAYCNQLMGIARRKAGTVVSCPTCRGQVVVPTPLPAGPVNGPAANVFEQKDFDPELFNPQPVAAAPGPAPDPATVPAPVPALAAAYEHQALAEPAPVTGGVVLTPARVTMLAVGAFVLAGVAFAVGFLMGRWI